MEYYSAMKMNKVLISLKTYINLESIMLNENNYSKRPYNISFHIHKRSEMGESVET